MGRRLRRERVSASVGIASGAAPSSIGGITGDKAAPENDGIVEVSEFTYGGIQLPAAWTAANIGFKVSTSRGGTYVPLYDKTGARVQIASPDASRAFDIPAEVFMFPFFKLNSESAVPADVTQAAARTILVTLGS